MKFKKADLIMLMIVLMILITGVSVGIVFREKKTNTRAEGETKTVLAEIETEDKKCSLEIRCNTILDHLEEVPEGKLVYIPENGIILEETEVSFNEGDTVFDILCKICQEAEIQLEYSWTPVYDSYYIEGMNHLYEFDFGGQSGWMYQVNDVFPNYGCSAYEIKDGDQIVWCYTIEGLGIDIGAKME